MELKIKFLKWSTGVPVAMLNEKTARKIGIHALDRVLIKTTKKNSKSISTITNTIEGLVGKNEIAVSSELKTRLGLKEGQKVDVKISSTPNSVFYIKKKLDGKKLSQKEVTEIISDIVSNSLSEPEVALFVSAMYDKGMSMKETTFLINAILETGNKLNYKKGLMADKHSIGGIPGNRTTPIVVSICASAGLVMPKTSSKAITSAAGTADVIEAIADVDFSIEDIKKILNKTNACLTWGGSLEIVPADSKIIKVEKLLKLDPRAQLLASIMSKKLAMGAKYILIDIPYGKGAKVSHKEGLELKKQFEYLGRYFNKKLKCVLTKGSEPIGNGIGPILELRDILEILSPEEDGPKDLERKSLFLAGEILEMTEKAKKGEGVELARSILYSGDALKKFEEIIKAQGGRLRSMNPGKFKKDILSQKAGKIKEIKNKEINSLARVSGCPVSKRSGLYLHFHVGDSVKKGEKILTIYSESKSRLDEAVKYYEDNKPIIF